MSLTIPDFRVGHVYMANYNFSARFLNSQMTYIAKDNLVVYLQCKTLNLYGSDEYSYLMFHFLNPAGQVVVVERKVKDAKLFAELNMKEVI